MRPEQRSRLRRKVQDLYLQMGEILKGPLRSALPTFAGVVYQLRTRCGKAHCVCREGRLHTAWCASYSEEGRRRLRTLPPKQVRELRELAERYRRLRRARARMTRCFGEMMRILDRLERSLRRPPPRIWAGEPREEG